MSNQNRVRIAIVGAGPAGLTLAFLLARAGIEVKLIEAARNFQRSFRGEALMPSGLEAIERMGLAEVLDRVPHRTLDGWGFAIERRYIFAVDEPIESGGKPCTLISQPAFLDAVLELASKYTNFEFISGVGVKDLIWQDNRITGVKLSDERQLDADLVIGADGRNSIVRQKANLTLDRSPTSFDILWFKFANLQTEIPQNIFYSIVAGDAAFGLFHGAEGNLQIGWSLHDGARDRYDPNAWQEIDWIEKFATAAPPDLAAMLRQRSISELERPILLSVTVGLCPRWHLPGLLLLGDAAHPMSPIRAQGINMALRDAIVAANYLVPVFTEDKSIESLDIALAKIQADREPEIVRIQQLQREEVGQAELLKNFPPLKTLVSLLAPKLPPLQSRLRRSWIDRQCQMRQGLTSI